MLREHAIEHAKRATELDRRGCFREALEAYRKTIETLRGLYELTLQKAYLEIIDNYARRIRELEVCGLKRAPEKGFRIEDLALREKPQVTWENVVDLDLAKQAIREAIVYPTSRPDLFPLGWPTGILLFGPPGCGKTLLAAATANEIDAEFYYVSTPTILSKWLGESERNVAELFKEARKRASAGKPVILFFDEIDSLAGIRPTEVGGEVRARNQLLQELDGISTKASQRRYLYCIASTNKPWCLDEAFLRRFQKRVYVPLPDFRARIEMFKLYAKTMSLADDVSFERLAQLTDGYSGSDIRDVCQAAYMRIVREFFEEKRKEFRPLCMDDFLSVLKERKPSVSRELLWTYGNWASKYAAG